jgi:hypothetical protein
MAPIERRYGDMFHWPVHAMPMLFIAYIPDTIEYPQHLLGWREMMRANAAYKQHSKETMFEMERASHLLRVAYTKRAATERRQWLLLH